MNKIKMYEIIYQMVFIYSIHTSTKRLQFAQVCRKRVYVPLICLILMPFKISHFHISMLCTYTLPQKLHVYPVKDMDT